MTLYMDKKPDPLKARLKWEAACERLAFALAPPAGQVAADAPDVASAIALVQAALEEVRQAFAADCGPSPP